MKKQKEEEMHKNKKQKGFTLIELIIVIAIVGILAAIAIPTYLGFQNRARDSASVSAVGVIRTGLAANKADNGTYPTTSRGAGEESGLFADLAPYLAEDEVALTADINKLPSGSFLSYSGTTSTYLLKVISAGTGGTITATTGGVTVP